MLYAATSPPRFVTLVLLTGLSTLSLNMFLPSLPNIAAEVDAETMRHPVGVCVGITPYNFPFMVPLWMFPVALVCGNTFILKPSEKVPLSAIRLGELLLEAREREFKCVTITLDDNGKPTVNEAVDEA